MGVESNEDHLFYEYSESVLFPSNKAEGNRVNNDHPNHPSHKKTIIIKYMVNRSIELTKYRTR